jgi:hypothetical protein
MRCRHVKKVLRAGEQAWSPQSEPEVARHLEICGRCRDAARIGRLSHALLAALREPVVPDPAFYARLRARLAALETPDPAEMAQLQLWGFARRLIPALACGVLLLGGVTASLTVSRSLQRVHQTNGREMHAFSFEEADLPAAVGRPTQDQMLAFVLRREDAPEAGPPGGGSGR